MTQKQINKHEDYESFRDKINNTVLNTVFTEEVNRKIKGAELQGIMTEVFYFFKLLVIMFEYLWDYHYKK